MKAPDFETYLYEKSFEQVLALTIEVAQKGQNGPPQLHFSHEKFVTQSSPKEIRLKCDALLRTRYMNEQ